jgi:hypothetical protein
VESLFTASLHIRDFVQAQNEAKILTKVSNGRLQKLNYGLSFDGLISIDPVGRSGGLSLF